MSAPLLAEHPTGNGRGGWLTRRRDTSGFRHTLRCLNVILNMKGVSLALAEESLNRRHFRIREMRGLRAGRVLLRTYDYVTAMFSHKINYIGS